MTTVNHPLTSTVGAIAACLSHETLQLGLPEAADGWFRCIDVDERFIADWERVATNQMRVEYGRSDPMSASAYVLGWYGYIPGIIGGLAYALARRVPNLGPEDIAFGCHSSEGYPDRYALLSSQFWCLPDDLEAEHPDAIVVADVAALAQILRAQIRGHADAFLAAYRGGARLPRRNLRGAFFDGLDVGIWLHEQSPGAESKIIDVAREALPGSTAEFRDRSTLHMLNDTNGNCHLTRERISCCYYYKVSDRGQACVTCPRTSIDERSRRLAEIEE